MRGCGRWTMFASAAVLAFAGDVAAQAQPTRQRLVFATLTTQGSSPITSDSVVAFTQWVLDTLTPRRNLWVAEKQDVDRQLAASGFVIGVSDFGELRVLGLLFDASHAVGITVERRAGDYRVSSALLQPRAGGLPPALWTFDSPDLRTAAGTLARRLANDTTIRR